MWVPASVCQPSTFAPNFCTNIKSVPRWFIPKFDLQHSKIQRRIIDFGLLQDKTEWYSTSTMLLWYFYLQRWDSNSKRTPAIIQRWVTVFTTAWWLKGVLDSSPAQEFCEWNLHVFLAPKWLFFLIFYQIKVPAFLHLKWWPLWGKKKHSGNTVATDFFTDSLDLCSF